MHYKSWSICSYIIAVIAITMLTYSHYSIKEKLTVIDYDVAGYYAYLPATFIYKDLKQLEWRSDIIKNYRVNALDNCAPEHESGGQVIKYPAGMSISYLPGFLVAHLYALNSEYVADGFSPPYQVGLIIIGWLYMLIALWYLRKLLSIYFEDKIVAATLVIISLGTNYYIYAGSHTMMSHAFLFLLFTLIIYHTIKWYERPTLTRIVGVGTLLGLTTITRQSEVLLSFVVLFWGISNWSDIKNRFRLFSKYRLHLLFAIVAAFLVISIQLIYWKHVSGDWIVYSYKGEGFTWDGRYLRECFFGFRKGWLVYTPVMILGILGLFTFYNSNITKTISKPIIIFLIISTYIIFSWDNYWYGGGFGQRAMISSYVLFSLSIASWLRYISNKNILLKIATSLFVLFCIWLNIFQTYQTQVWGGFETETMSKKYYLQIFGERHIHPDWKTFLDNKDAVLGEVKLSEPLFEENFNSYLGTKDRLYKDTKTFKLGTFGLFTLLDTTVSDVKKGDRLRAQIITAGVNRIWNRSNMSNLHVQLIANGKVMSDESVRIQDVARDGTWKPLHVDIKARHENIDQIKVLAWCSRPEDVVYIADLKVYRIE